jgi:hypothetical protein
MWHFVAVPAIQRAIRLDREVGASSFHMRRSFLETEIFLGRLILLAAIVMIIVINVTSGRA